MRLRTKIAIIISLLLIVVGFGTVSSRRMQDKRPQLSNKSKTSALEIVKIEVRNDIEAAIVTFKNVSSKNINAVRLAYNKGSLQIDFLGASEPERQRLGPGTTYQETLPLTNASEEFEVSVLAVTFDDKSSDGDPESIKQIIDARRGFTKEMKRLRPLLEAAIASPDGDSSTILDRLKSQVEALPLEKSDDSSDFRQGQTEARQDFLYEVQFLKERQAATGQVQIRSALAKDKIRYDKRIDYDH